MEEVPALVWREEIADVADGLDKLVEGPGADAPEVRLEFREGHFDRVEIRTAGRNRKWQPWAWHPRGGIAVVGGQVVEDDHGPWVQFRDRNLFDAGIEGIPIQGSGDHPGCHDPIAGQACDQGPVPHRRNDALPLSRSPPGLRPYSRVIPVSVPVSSRKISR